MALKTLADLKNELYQFSNSASGDYNSLGGTIDSIIVFAENRIFREVRCREMEQTLTSTVTIASGVLTLPNDFVDLKYMYLKDSQPYRFLENRTAGWVRKRYPNRAASGKPLFVAREGGSFIFGPYPDTGTTYTVGGYYWGRPTTLIGTTTTASCNLVYQTHPDLYLAACVAETPRFFAFNDQIAAWESKYQQIRNNLLEEVKTEFYEGSEILGDE